MYTCKSGRLVAEYAMTNGATHVEIDDGSNLTEPEWDEYCAHVRALSLQQSRARLAGRRDMNNAMV